MDTSSKRLLKKATAVVLSITMAFGALMLPGKKINQELMSASAIAYVYEANNCVFEYTVNENDDTATITYVQGHAETVEVPAVIPHEGSVYNVTAIDSEFLKGDKIVRTVIFPDSVKSIQRKCLYDSSVEDIVLPDGLEELGSDFAANCPELRSVKYNGTKIKGNKMGLNILGDSELSGIKNEKGAVCLGNWLIYYLPDSPVTSVKISDLGNNGVKIENIGYGACVLSWYNIDTDEITELKYLPDIDTVDLEGIKYISNSNFRDFKKLTTVKNHDSVEEIKDDALINTPWYENCKKDGLLRVGSVLIYYRSDTDTIDLTSGDLAGIKEIKNNALTECKNVETIICGYDAKMDSKFLYKAYEQPGNCYGHYDPLPVIPTYNIKKFILNGSELNYTRIMEDPEAKEWFGKNYYSLEGSEFILKMAEEKTKVIFDQLDIPYYGMDNDKIGTLTPTEEFYIRLKIHNYLSIYDYGDSGDHCGFVCAFLVGGKVMCDGYAEIAHYMLECAGVEAKTFYTDPDDPKISGVHLWNGTKIGDEWFLSDDGWDAQVGGGNHSSFWFLNSYDSFHTSVLHEFMVSFDSVHFYPETESKVITPAERTVGDTDNNGSREPKDAELLRAYLKGETDTIDQKGADVNFDGKIDITDAVLLENFVNGKTIDPDNVPTDGLAPAVTVAFVNGDDYDNIKYAYTDRNGYITLPDGLFEAPEGMKLSYDAGKVGEKVRITTPLKVVQVKWVDKNAPEYILGDVNGDGSIDIEDAVAIIQHINGVTALSADEESRADVSKDNNIDIDDAVTLISYINGNSTF